MRWLPTACVLVLLVVVSIIATRWSVNSGPNSIPAPVWNEGPALELSAQSVNSSSAEPDRATTAAAQSVSTALLTDIAAPIPVAPPPSGPIPALTVAMELVPAVEPPVPVAAAMPAPGAFPSFAASQMISPTASAPTSTPNGNVTSGAAMPVAPVPTTCPPPAQARDNAPTTAREDAAKRSWPYPPLAPPAPMSAQSAEGTMPTMPLAAPLLQDNAAAKELNDPLAGWGPPPAPSLDPRRFTEAHWQGIEVIPNTPLVATALKIPPDAKGVIADDVTLPADLQGFQGGDLVTQVAQVPTPDLTSFIAATDWVRDQRQVEVAIIREGQPRRLQLTALKERLGNANGETASMIRPGARMPHPYRGPCTNCHRIGTTGTIPIDQGDMTITTAPTIRADAVRPHRDRGPCTACHQVLP